MKVIDVKDGVTKALREWAKREGLMLAYRVEIDEATLEATVHEFVRDAEGKPQMNAAGTGAETRVRTTRVSSLP